MDSGLGVSIFQVNGVFSFSYKELQKFEPPFLAYIVTNLFTLGLKNRQN